jgi:hypothetical protein
MVDPFYFPKVTKGNERLSLKINTINAALPTW